MNDFTQFLLTHGGPVLFAVVLVDQAGVPLPSAPWLLAAGALSASGNLNPLLAIALTIVACLIPDTIWFYVGRRSGQRVLRLFCRMSLSPNSCVGRSKGVFARHGLQGLVAAKFLPVVGAVMPPLAGALGMSTGQFLLFDSLGAMLYAIFYIEAGSLFHNQVQQLVAVLNQLGFSAMLLGLGLASAYLVFKYIRRHRNPVRQARHQIAKQQEAAPEPEPSPATLIQPVTCEL